jgi:drug/metabolite transporter (DMT)-like permease
MRLGLRIASTRIRSSSSTSRGYLICFLATVLLSSTAIFIRYLTEEFHIPALVLAFWRDLIVSVSVFAALAYLAQARLRFERIHLNFLLVYGFVLAVFNSLWTISVALNGAAVSTVLVYCSAAFTAILGWRVLGEQLGWVKITAVALSFLGCIFVSEAYAPEVWQVNPVGVITGILSGLAYAIYSLFGKASARRGLYPWTMLAYTFFIAAVFLLGFNYLSGWLPQGVASTEFLWLGSSLLGWGVLAVLALGPTIGGFGFYTISLTYLPASVANIIATLEPVITTFLAFLFLGERFNPPQWLGGGLIISGVILLRLRSEPDS